MATIDRGVRMLAVDLDRLEYISSSGLRALIMALKKLKGLGGGLALFAVRDHLKEVFDLAGFTALFCIGATEAEAVAALSQGRQG